MLTAVNLYFCHRRKNLLKGVFCGDKMPLLTTKQQQTETKQRKGLMPTQPKLNPALIRQLQNAIRKARGTGFDINWMLHPGNFEKVCQIARGEGEVVLSLELASLKEANVAPSGIIRVDRSAPVVYPSWAKGLVYPEHQSIGPSEYELSKVQKWLTDEQKRRWDTLSAVHAKLQEKEFIRGCLTLADGYAIQKEPEVFHEIFGIPKRPHLTNGLMLWLSLVESNEGPQVACLHATQKKQVVMTWKKISGEHALIGYDRAAGYFPQELLAAA